MTDPRYKTFGNRFAVGFIDGLFFIPLGVIDFIVFAQIQNTALTIVWATLSYSSRWLYSSLLHGLYGQTIGKRLFKIRVVDNRTEGPITMRQAFLRDGFLIVANTLSLAIGIYEVLNAGITLPEWVQVADIAFGYAALAWFLLEIGSCLLNRKNRAVHDFIAGTVVVNLDTETPEKWHEVRLDRNALRRSEND